jgi:predicted metalloprotease with PDZ domain
MPLPALRYRLDLTGHGHEVAVTLVVPREGTDAGRLRLYLPRWAPGSYLVREFARHVDWISASQGGRELAIRKSGTDEWTIDEAGGGDLAVRYGLYARELTVRTNYLDHERALIAGAATFLVPEGCEARDFELEVIQPDAWPEPQCALPSRDGIFLARGYDDLIDAPLAAGPCTVADFDVRGVPHRVAVYGRGDADAQGLAGPLRALCEAAAGVFGGDVPCERYLFIVEIGCAGGLEHADSSVCGFPVVSLTPDAEKRANLSLVAHEYFHLWNVKRIRPAALGPFDYRREALTPHLWVAEGLTSYYQYLLLQRAGILSPERLLAVYAGHVLELESTPGRLVQTLEESSHDAWIKFYRPHENTPNTTVSYYGKGAVVGLVLDLEIRARTAGRRSLDDVMRELWSGWKRRPERGFTDDELRAAFAAAAGSSMDAAIDECVRTRGELDVDSRLAAAGLELVRRKPREGGSLGVAFRRSEGRLLVERVVRDGPAAIAGLSPGEELIAIDGFRVDESEARALLDRSRPGQRVALTTTHWSRLREVEVTLGERPSSDYRMRKRRDAGEAERRVLKAWLGKTFEELDPLDEPHEERRAARGPRTA